MSAELISVVSRCPVPMGVLADGTLYYAPIGEVMVTGPLVTCHLCGRSLRSVTAHLRAHGWTKLAYCEAFGLERGQSLEGPETRKLRAAVRTSRLVFEPAVMITRTERLMMGGLSGSGVAAAAVAGGRRGEHRGGIHRLIRRRVEYGLGVPGPLVLAVE